MAYSIGAGKKYFVKYGVIFLLLPAPMLCALVINGWTGIFAGGVLSIFFLYPAAVKLILPSYYIEAGGLFRVTVFGKRVLIACLKESRVSFLRNSISYQDVRGRRFVIEKADFFPSDWASVCDFFRRVAYEAESRRSRCEDSRTCLGA